MRSLLRPVALLFGLTLFGCGGAATDDWNNFQNKKTADARAGYEAGMALHEKYMAAKMPELPRTREAVQKWAAASKPVINKINEHFRPVMYTTFYDKVFFAHLRLGEASEKRAVELSELHAPLKGDDAMMSDHYVLEALLDAATFYKFAADTATDHPEVKALYGEQAARAAKKSAEFRAKYEALKAR